MGYVRVGLGVAAQERPRITLAAQMKRIGEVATWPRAAAVHTVVFTKGQATVSYQPWNTTNAAWENAATVGVSYEVYRRVKPGYEYSEVWIDPTIFDEKIAQAKAVIDGSVKQGTNKTASQIALERKAVNSATKAAAATIQQLQRGNFYGRMQKLGEMTAVPRPMVKGAEIQPLRFWDVGMLARTNGDDWKYMYTTVAKRPATVITMDHTTGQQREIDPSTGVVKDLATGQIVAPTEADYAMANVAGQQTIQDEAAYALAQQQQQQASGGFGGMVKWLLLGGAVLGVIYFIKRRKATV